MNHEPISAIDGLNIDSNNAIAERYQNQQDKVNLSNLESMGLTQGGSSIQVTPVMPSPGSEMMNFRALSGYFSDGLKNGFYAKDLARLSVKTEKSKDPSSGISTAQVMSDILQVQVKMGITDALSKVSSKLSEGLQTLVVKQG
jgi:hypothetical protein